MVAKNLQEQKNDILSGWFAVINGQGRFRVCWVLSLGAILRFFTLSIRPQALNENIIYLEVVIKKREIVRF